MKKTKFFAVTLSLAFMGALSLSLAACGDEEKTETTTEPAEDDGRLISEVLTADEWAAAFSAENFVNMKIVVTSTLSGKYE